MANDPSKMSRLRKDYNYTAYSPRLHAASKTNLQKILLVDGRSQIPCPTFLWRSNPEIADRKKYNCFSTEGKILKVPRSCYEVLFKTSSNKKRDERKKENKLPVIAGQSAGLLYQRVMPNYHDQCVFSLFRGVFDLVAPAPLNSVGNRNMITQKLKELRLTFIQEKNFDHYLKSCRMSRPDV